MYYVNILRLMFSQLEVSAKISVLSNSPTCALKKLMSDKEMEACEKLGSISAGSMSIVQFGWQHYVKDSQCWPCATCYKLDG